MLRDRKAVAWHSLNASTTSSPIKRLYLCPYVVVIQTSQKRKQKNQTLEYLLAPLLSPNPLRDNLHSLEAPAIVFEAGVLEVDKTRVVALTDAMSRATRSIADSCVGCKRLSCTDDVS